MKKEQMLSEEIQLIGADLGRGYAKGFSSYKGKDYDCCFKSIVGIGREIDLNEYEEPIYLEVENEEYFAGMLAEKEGHAATSNNMDSKVTLTAQKLLYAVLDKIAVADTVRIMLGVPNKSFNKRTLKDVEEMYTGKEVTIKNKITKQYKTILIDKISIFRESDAALFWELRNQTTNNKPVGMVTIGFRTTEFTYFDKGMKFNDKLSKSEELGNKTTLTYVRDYLQKNNNITKELFEIDTNKDDYQELKARGYMMLSESIGQKVDDLWINTDEMDLYFGGGTAKNMTIYKDTLIDDPQMATAKGLWLVAKNIIK